MGRAGGAAERFGPHAREVQAQQLSFTWDGVTRGSEGDQDYAAAYVARHLPDLDFADMRSLIIARDRDAEGRLIADYLRVTGRVR